MPFEPVLEEQSRAFTHVTTLGRWVRRYEGAAPLSEECPQRDSKHPANEHFHRLGARTGARTRRARTDANEQKSDGYGRASSAA